MYARAAASACGCRRSGRAGALGRDGCGGAGGEGVTGGILPTAGAPRPQVQDQRLDGSEGEGGAQPPADQGDRGGQPAGGSSGQRGLGEVGDPDHLDQRDRDQDRGGRHERCAGDAAAVAWDVGGLARHRVIVPCDVPCAVSCEAARDTRQARSARRVAPVRNWAYVLPHI
ncbi:hypothetical protein GCM10009815_19960 [Nocardioides marmoribigeumensis]